MTSAVHGDVLKCGDPESAVDTNEQRIHRSGSRKLLHFMKCSRLNILNMSEIFQIHEGGKWISHGSYVLVIKC